MKARTQTLIYLSLLFLLFGTTVAIILGVKPPSIIIADQVWIEPRPIAYPNTDTVTVTVKISTKIKGQMVPIVDQIDPATVRLEGWLAPVGDPWYTMNPPEFVAQFDGYYVGLIIQNKIGHMGLTRPHAWNPARVPLDISGKLYEEDGGTPWEGTGYARVYNLPPPPPN